MSADFWNSVQHAAHQEVVSTAAQLFRAKVIEYVGNKINVQREHNSAPDGVPYPVLDGLVKPSVGEYVWCLQKTGGVVVLGRNLDASNKLAAYATNSSVDTRIAAPVVNDVEGNTPPSAYPLSSVSVKIRGNGTGFPTAHGTLITFGAHFAPVYTSQMWFPTSGAQPSTRGGTGADGWTPWISVAPPVTAELVRGNGSVFTSNFNIFRNYRQLRLPGGLQNIDTRVEAKIDLIKGARIAQVEAPPVSNSIFPVAYKPVGAPWSTGQVYVDVADGVLRVEQSLKTGDLIDLTVSWVA